MVSRVLLNFFYKVSAEYAGRSSQGTLPRDAIVVYLMNHRSNADYVLVQMCAAVATGASTPEAAAAEAEQRAKRYFRRQDR